MYQSIKRSTSEYSNYTALNFLGTKFSYNKIISEIDKVADSFLSLGVNKGDIVSIALPNMPQTVYCVFALNKIGAIASMIHPLSSKNELIESVKKTNSKVLICLNDLIDISIIKDLYCLEKLILTSAGDSFSWFKKTVINFSSKKNHVGNKDNRVLSYSKFLSLPRHSFNSEYKEHEDDVAIIFSSGGTTGKRKYVCLTNKNIETCAIQLGDRIKVTSGDRMLSIMPMFHGNGAVTGIYFPLINGMCCILIPRFSTKIYIKNLLKYKCNFISGKPSLLQNVIKDALIQDADLSYLKGVFSGADFLSVEAEDKINKFLEKHNSPVKVRQGYGLTEGVVISTLIPDGVSKPGSIGLPLKDVILKIVKSGTEEELKTGEVGEIIFSSDTTMKGYFNNTQATNNILKRHADGNLYVHSQDLGYVDEDGYLYFKGRLKRMIVTNGYNIFPVEIENIIEAHKDVSRCCVLGVPDEKRGEKVVAYILPDKKILDVNAFKEMIFNKLKDNIPKYAMPRQIFIVDEMPLTNVGKIDYKKLRPL